MLDEISYLINEFLQYVKLTLIDALIVCFSRNRTDVRGEKLRRRCDCVSIRRFYNATAIDSSFSILVIGDLGKAVEELVTVMTEDTSRTNGQRAPPPAFKQ